MKEKRQLKRICRYHRVSHNERLEALISLNKDCIWIKIDSIFDVPALRRTRFEIYMTFAVHYAGITKILRDAGVSKTLTDKVVKVLIAWKKEQKFKFDEMGKILINGGQNNENIRKN